MNNQEGRPTLADLMSMRGLSVSGTARLAGVNHRTITDIRDQVLGKKWPNPKKWLVPTPVLQQINSVAF